MTITHTAYDLARMAGVASPDLPTSPGAAWLEQIAASLDDYEWDNDNGSDNSDTISEMANNIVPIYTHNKWSVFVDLCAYQEDISEFGEFDDMERASSLALLVIAERLATALVAERTEATE